jgi:hypothetical protein
MSLRLRLTRLENLRAAGVETDMNADAAEIIIVL